ncbi:DedA family protein [Phytohabitans flavus]|uniref:DedA family protein n=1 Tax=Phytohabitans flavus TaxID=1076124 RepID=UPI0031ECC434
MLDQVIPLVTSPWIYLVVFVVVALDAFFPAVPSEAIVVGVSTFAAHGDPSIVGLIAAAAVGAFLGDTVSYGLGRHALGSGRFLRARALRAAHDWAGRTLQSRGGTVLVVSRYIPGGRTAATLVAGSVRYPIQRFWFFTAIAAVSWALYSTGTGYLGGRIFHDHPYQGILAGLALAFGLTLAIEGVRYLVNRRAAKKAVTVPDMPVSPRP